MQSLYALHTAAIIVRTAASTLHTASSALCTAASVLPGVCVMPFVLGRRKSMAELIVALVSVALQRNTLLVEVITDPMLCLLSRNALLIPNALLNRMPYLARMPC